MTGTLFSYVALAVITLVAMPVYWLAVPKGWRSAVLLVASVVYIASQDLWYAAFFVVNTAIVFALAGAIRKAGDGKVRLLQFSLVWLIGGLCLFKYVRPLAAVLPEGAVPSIVTRLVLPLGMSYITFRMIHYVVEVYRGRAAESSFADFASYVLFFPTYISGPVERFPPFHKQTAAQKSFDLEDVNYGLYRIISGILKKVTADTMAPFIVPVLNHPTESSPLVVLLAVYGLAIKVYLDFSGYTDIALGIGRMFGYKIMENFNWPYLRKNIAEFWRNWHISVYSFIRDYFFLPFFSRRPSNLKTSLGIFCTMLLFMLWHEATWQFLAVGAYHGTGLVAYFQVQELKSRYRGLRTFLAQKWLVPISTFVTFTFVSFSFLVFDYRLPHIAKLVAHLLSL